MESLEGRVVLAAGIGFEPRLGVVSIVGADAADVATVTQEGRTVVVSLTGVEPRTFAASKVKVIDFKGFGGDDSFTNNTAIRSRADGGAGSDTLRGGAGADDFRGGDDNDHLFGNRGNDSLRGGNGGDTIDGGPGNDREYGEAGDDDLYGGEGSDALYGGGDDDDIYGDAGNDRIYGETGDDHLDGRVGRDWIVGGPGLDREDDDDDRFRDGDDDGDGYDNDHDRPVAAGIMVTPVTFADTAPGVSTARVTGESATERDRDYYSFTAPATRTLTVAVAADANGRFAEVEVKNGATGKKVLELEPAENAILSAQVPVVAGVAYVIVVHSSSDTVAAGYTVDLTLDDTPISPIIGTEVVFSATGFAQLTGTVVGDDSKRIFSFTATSAGSMKVTTLPDANNRHADVEVSSRTTRRKLLELEPSEKLGKTSGTIAIVAGQTYVFEIESPDDDLSVTFTVDIQLS